MSRAVHCDRCGREMLACELAGSAGLSVARRGRGGAPEELDLCPDCLEALDAFMAEGGTLRRVNRGKPRRIDSAAPQGHPGGVV